jgi:transposase InsO family protein
VVNHKRVLKLMRQEKLLCHKKKFKPETTDSTNGLPIYPNLLKDREITGLNKAWASDITYVQLQHEHIFLAIVLDIFSRKCIGLELSRSIRSDLAMNALAKALKNLTAESIEGLIHHSDQGVQSDRWPQSGKNGAKCPKPKTSKQGSNQGNDYLSTQNQISCSQLESYKF